MGQVCRLKAPLKGVGGANVQVGRSVISCWTDPYDLPIHPSEYRVDVPAHGCAKCITPKKRMIGTGHIIENLVVVQFEVDKVSSGY